MHSSRLVHNARAIAQGSPERNISAVVSELLGPASFPGAPR